MDNMENFDLKGYLKSKKLLKENFGKSKRKKSLKEVENKNIVNFLKQNFDEFEQQLVPNYTEQEFDMNEVVEGAYLDKNGEPIKSDKVASIGDLGLDFSFDKQYVTSFDGEGSEFEIEVGGKTVYGLGYNV